MADTVLPVQNVQDVRPIPDPTQLTTQQLLREISGTKELIFTRLDAMDRAIVLFNDNMTRVPTDTDKQISHLKELHDERFHSIAVQFQERDTRTEQTSRDSKVAVDAALQAAKEAVGEQNKSSALAIAKSEASTTKQIDQIAVLIATGQAGANDKIDDLKMRVTSVEGRSQGGQNSNATMFAVISAVASAFAIVAVIVMLFARGTGHA